MRQFHSVHLADIKIPYMVHLNVGCWNEKITLELAAANESVLGVMAPSGELQ